MGVSFVVQAIAGRSKKDAKVTAHVSLDTRLLVAFAEAVAAEGPDEPDGVTLNWAEGQDYDAPLVPRDCYSPDEVVQGLLWLQQLAADGEDPARAVWLDYGSGAFTVEAFVQGLSRDLDRVLELCRGAKARGDKVIGIWVP